MRRCSGAVTASDKSVKIAQASPSKEIRPSDVDESSAIPEAIAGVIPLSEP
jgi:hypothetical protein